MARHKPLVVFSDVDVVFDCASPNVLDSAARMLAMLTSDHVSLVLCSRKTRAELEHISQGLGINHPFICESGSAAFIPKGYLGFDVPDAREVAGYEAVEFGHPHATVVDTLHRTAERLRIRVRGFSDMSVEEVASECHLSLLQARLAKLREYGELFRVLDPDSSARARLFKALHGARLLCTPAERFDHVGAAVDHRLGVDLLCDLYQRACGPVLSVGLADAEREGSLLQLVDIPVAVNTTDNAIASSGARQQPATTVATVREVEEWVETIIEVVQDVRQAARFQRRPDPPI